jgi:tyrosine-protein kinase Etk/Wzc
LLKKMFAFKYVYVASVFFFVILAYLYIKYSPKIYELDSTIGPSKDTRSAALVSGDMFNSASNPGVSIENAINGLYSFSLISKTVNDMNLEVGYYVDSVRLFKQSTEIYLQSPFIVNLDKSHIQTIGAKFDISIVSDSTFRISTKKKAISAKKNIFLYNYLDNEIVDQGGILYIDTICRFNDMISNRNFRFFISPSNKFVPGSSANYKKYHFELFHPEELAKLYMKKLYVRPESYMASIIKVQFSSKNLEKSLNFLNNFVNYFLNDNLAKKNKIALSTMNFIDSQISEMSDSLVKSESTLRNFRSDNQVMDLSYQGQQLYRQLADLEAELTTLRQKKQYYDYVLNYFKTNQDISGITPPSSANITDPIMSDLISDMISTNAERSTISSSSEKNLFLIQIENKLKIQKQTIIENVTNTLNTLNLTEDELVYKAQKLSSEISNLPKQEMRMVNIQRKFNLDNTLYTYLLQKRSEAAIALSSTYPDYEVLEPARVITSKVIKPKVKMNFLLALFLGFFFPTVFLISRDLLSDKISNIYDIDYLLDRSAFGIIYNNAKKFESVFTESPKSAIAESFRNLRSSLFNKLKSKQAKVILITSSQPQDGKSFISFNLATAIASVGFKTVLMDCDLRHPVQHTKFMVKNSSGISDFMTKKVREDEIIHKTSVENLSFIPAGPVLENPSELISSGILDDLISFLKSNNEYIIIDTPPVGLIADSLQLMKYASQVLIVTRNNYTKKQVLLNAIASLNSNRINNFEVIVNDLALEKSAYSGYKGYYHEE